jgi:ABC-type branched-subunit amino acid transport system substrate-binding protein
MLRFVLIAAMAAVLWSGAPTAAETIDDQPDIVSEYARGKRLMREGNFLDASRLFMQLVGRFPDSKNVDLFIFNRAKADYYFGNFSEALAAFGDYIRRFPNAGAVAHAYFFQGNIYYLKNQLNRAVNSYVEAFRLCGDPRLKDLIVGSMVSMVNTAENVSLGPADFSRLSETNRCELLIPVADALMARQATESAARLMNVCGRQVDISTQTASGNIGEELELALLLPFSGELQAFGEDIHHGAIVAADQIRRETGRAIRLVPYDTKGDPIDAARIIKELANSGTDAVIGPLTSEETAVTSAILNCEYLPMIAPAATQSGLTLLSESAFQLSPNIELQGVRAAEYAFANRGADSAAIITPTSPDHLRMARAFAERFQDLGGTLVAIEYYRPRDNDFGPYVRDLKATLLGLHPDSMFFINEMGDTLDVEAVPAGIDCLYLPGVAGQLRLLLPQLNFYSINSFYIGSDGWGDDAIYRLADNLTKQAVFPSPFLEQEQSRMYVQFAADFDRLYGEQPHRLASLGYDAVRLIGMAVDAGATSREEIVANLAHITNYPGAAATVTFGEFRENIELPMYRLIDGVPVYLGEAAAVEGSSGQ